MCQCAHVVIIISFELGCMYRRVRDTYEYRLAFVAMSVHEFRKIRKNNLQYINFVTTHLIDCLTNSIYLRHKR